MSVCAGRRTSFCKPLGRKFTFRLLGVLTVERKREETEDEERYIDEVFVQLSLHSI